MPYPFAIAISHRRASTTLEYGNAVLETYLTTDTVCYRQQAVSLNPDGIRTDAPTVDWDYQIPPGPPLTRHDLIDQGGVTHEIIGDPELIVHPWTGADDHWEFRCRALSDV